MKNWDQEAVRKLPDDKYLKHQVSGSFVSVTRKDGKVSGSTWYDNKPISVV